jgi:hypothetical protein
MKPCQCPPCLLLAYLSLATAAAGDLQTAERIAESITWTDDASEGYSDTWRTSPSADSSVLN